MSAKKVVTFDVLIEIPKGSRNKYEYDFTLHKIRFDRMLFSSMMYPGDYGFIPETLALDSDPLDVLVLGHQPTYPMVVMEVRPIGVFYMTDEKGPDEKIICVPVYSICINYIIYCYSVSNIKIRVANNSRPISLILFFVS